MWSIFMHSYKLCLVYCSWQSTSFGRLPSWVAFIQGFYCMLGYVFTGWQWFQRIHCWFITSTVLVTLVPRDDASWSRGSIPSSVLFLRMYGYTSVILTTSLTCGESSACALNKQTFTGVWLLLSMRPIKRSLKLLSPLYLTGETWNRL